MDGLINVGELVKRIIKYLVEGLMVAIAAYAIPKRSLNIEEIVLIALTAAATFSILDTYVPTMGSSAIILLTANKYNILLLYLFENSMICYCSTYITHPIFFRSIYKFIAIYNGFHDIRRHANFIHFRL